MISYQKKILARYMSDKDLQSFEQTYKENCHKQKSVRPPSAKDQRVASHFIKSLSYTHTAEQLGVSRFYVMSAVGRAFAYKK